MSWSIFLFHYWWAYGIFHEIGKPFCCALFCYGKSTRWIDVNHLPKFFCRLTGTEGYDKIHHYQGTTTHIKSQMMCLFI